MSYDNRPDRKAKDQPPLVEIDRLRVEFKTRNGIVTAVQDVSLDIAKGETLGIVGESGSGKSVTSYALMRLLDRAGQIADGSVTFSGVDVANARETTMRDLRGREMSMIFQNPRVALNPIRKVGEQIADVLVQHAQASGAAARAKAVEMLDLVRIRDPQERFHAYPFELSGGMCQRVVIALALSCRPQLLIADEPTTGLDVTTQKAVMDLITELTQARAMSTILITHDLGLAAAYCTRIVVMKDGEVVEVAGRDALFAAPRHAYTRKLMRATPQTGLSVRALLPAGHSKADQHVATPEIDPAPPALLEVRNVVKSFAPQQGGAWASRLFGHRSELEQPPVRAVDDVSFSLARGGSLGLVGESGCGKSTTAAMIMRLLEPTSGSIKLDGIELTEVPVNRFARSSYRSRLQMVFQDPTDSLNPRFSARRAISDPIRMLGSPAERAHINERVEELASQVGLPIDLLDRFPHQLSGGQKARVGIARAIALKPDLLILDEPTAALDVSVQAVVLNLLHDLRVDLGMSYLFVSHDLNVVRMLCTDVLVMQAGQIVERGPTADVMSAPKSEYTRTLIDAIPHVPITSSAVRNESAP